MKLIEFKYKDANWELENLQLKDVNLLVGTNSSGKSRTLHFLSLVRDLILKEWDLEDVRWKNGLEWQLTFQTDENKILKYFIGTCIDERVDIFVRVNDRKIITETIIIDNVIVLERTNREDAKIKSFVTDEFEEIFPPAGKLVLHTRRDVRRYPFIENIIDWAEQLQLFKFGDISSLSLSNYYRQIPEIFSRLTPEQQLRIKKELNDIGYNIKDMRSTAITSVGERGLHYEFGLIEEGVNSPLNFYELSQGMVRSIVILIFIESALREGFLYKSSISTLLIDDFCEGLDYSKATKLGKLVFDKCKNSNIQLIVTSNDGFLMDTVDLQHWHVLKREGSKVNVINIDTYPEIFEKFKFTGLSNFDFFSSDFLEQNLNKS